MEELLEYLKKQPKEILQWLVFELMASNKLSFADLAEAHVAYLDKLKKQETEELMTLRSKIVSMWCDNKKNFGRNMVKLIQEGKDNGWVNIDQEAIDKSKWNKDTR